MSGVTYRYEQNYSFKKKGVPHTIKENVIDGNKGLTVLFLEKKGDDFYKIYAKEIKNDEFEITEKVGETEKPSQTVDEKGLIKMLKTHNLGTIINYISKERGTYKGKKIPLANEKPKDHNMSGGAKKKSSKKTSKKSSKKGSKK